MSETPQPRALLLSLLGDVVFPSGGQAPVRAITEVMGLLDVPPDESRQALRRLAEEGLVELKAEGDRTVCALTSAGRRRMDEAADRIYLRRRLRWDGRWRLLVVSIADRSADEDEAIRRELEWLGYGQIQADLWACPWDLGPRLDAVLAKHDVLGSVEAFTSEHRGDDVKLAATAYDLHSLQTAHRGFVDRFAPKGAEPHAHDSNVTALVERLKLVHTWRKFLFLDPGLPSELLPGDWLGDEAAKVFVAAYRAVEVDGWSAWEDIYAAADPDGARPEHVLSNLQVPLPATGPRQSVEERTRQFRERIAAGHKVEVGDWMPDEYRSLAIKFIEMHANSELMGALPEREWIARAPSLRRKRSLTAKVQDEVGHAQLLYRVAEDLGKPREDMLDDLVNGRTKFHNVFHYPAESWADVAVIGFLIDGAAVVSQRALLDSSYAPYVRVMRRVCAEESLHLRHGEDLCLELASGSDAQFAMLQDAVNRWWAPIMQFHGPPTPPERDKVLQWGIKSRANEDLRQEYLGQYVPKLWDMGIELPDPQLAYDAQAKVWRYSEPDWGELSRVVNGHGPLTHQRLTWRRWMRAANSWLLDDAPAVAHAKA
jgi:ring-1,2-phenylacetyl-CoA epoxidase subunit PaaA